MFKPSKIDVQFWCEGHLPGDLLAGHVQLHVQPHDLLLHEPKVQYIQLLCTLLGSSMNTLSSVQALKRL